MFILGPENKNTKSDMRVGKISKTAAKTEDYTKPTLESPNIGDKENQIPEEQDAESEDNPFDAGSTRNKVRKDPGKKISTEDTLDAADDFRSKNFPGYIEEE